MNRIEVIGLGALNTDYLYRVERILDDGEAVASQSTSSPGGSAANTIYGLAKLGISTGFIGVVGNDAEGKALIQDFIKVGADTSQIKVKRGAKTGSVLCLSDRLGSRSLYVVPGANNLLSTDDLDPSYINQTEMFHLSSFADDRQFNTSLELLNKVESSIKLSFSPGSLYAAKGLEALSSILARTYLLFVNQDEIQRLTGKDVISGAESCLKQGCRLVVVTLGKGTKLELGKGTAQAVGYIRDTENEYLIEPGNQNIISPADTTGAGDAFATGFLYGLLKGRGLKECGQLGNIVAQFCITKIGAREGLPTISELTQRHRELYATAL